MKRMSDYVLICNFYNEELAIPTFLERITKQTKQPRMTVLINDGSTDKSGEIADCTAQALEIDFMLIEFPKKKKGNLDTLGITWTRVQPAIKFYLKNVDYMAIADVDNRFQRDYFERGINYLEHNPAVGVISGVHSGGSVRHMPMGGGKITRAEIIRSIDTYWDFAVDSFINIKALAMNYKVRIVRDMLVTSPPTHLDNYAGTFRQGRLSYYVGTKPLYVILRGLFRKGTNYVRGYWQERSKNAWHCDDPDVKAYYGTEFRRKFMGLVLNWRKHLPQFIDFLVRRLVR